MLQISSLCQAEVGVSMDNLPGVRQFCLYLLILKYYNAMAWGY